MFLYKKQVSGQIWLINHMELVGGMDIAFKIQVLETSVHIIRESFFFFHAIDFLLFLPWLKASNQPTSLLDCREKRHFSNMTQAMT